MVFSRGNSELEKQMNSLSAEAKRKRKEWRQELAKKAVRRQKVHDKSQKLHQQLEKEHQARQYRRLRMLSPAVDQIQGHFQQRRSGAMSACGLRLFTKKPAPIFEQQYSQPTQTVLETVDCSTQTETELASIQRLCAELNKAKRRIATLERQLQKKTEEANLLKKRPAVENKSKLKRVSSLDDLSRQSRTARAKEIARNLSALFRPGTPIPEIDKVVRQARHQVNFISPKKPPGNGLEKGEQGKKNGSVQSWTSKSH